MRAVRSLALATIAQAQATEFYDLTPDEQADRAAQLAAAALVNWDISDAEIDLLKYRENAVYSIMDNATGHRYAMRVHRAGYHSDAALLSELQWMMALGDAGIPAPPVVPTARGELFVTVGHDAVPEPRQVDMIAWVNGEQIGNIENDQDADDESVRANYYKAGQLAARLHNHAQNWDFPTGFTRRNWDVDGLMGDESHFGCFWKLGLLSEEQRAQLLKARDVAGAQLDAFGKTPDRFGLTHADFLPENLLADGDVIHLIDFDDCGFGWHLMDIVTSLFFLVGEDTFDIAKDALIEGYRTERALPEEHLDMLLPLAVARGLSYLSWIQSRQETETAKEIGPVLVELVCYIAQIYLEERGK